MTPEQNSELDDVAALLSVDRTVNPIDQHGTYLTGELRERAVDVVAE